MPTARPAAAPHAPADVDTGVEGNARLTAATGLVLVTMLAVEGVTVLDVRGLITWHVAVGVALLGPVALKSASTSYRFARYYTRSPAYVRRGPPHPVLRWSGPLVLLSTLGVLGTGLALLTRRPDDSGLLLTAHKASFVGWFALMTVHVLGHLAEAARSAWRDLHPRPGDAAARRRALRLTAVTAALLLGVGAAAALLPAAHSWTHSTGEAAHR